MGSIQLCFVYVETTARPNVPSSKVVTGCSQDKACANMHVHAHVCMYEGTHSTKPLTHLNELFHRVSGWQALLLNPKEVSTSVSQATAQQGHNVQIGAGHLHDPPGNKAGKVVIVTECHDLAA